MSVCLYFSAVCWAMYAFMCSKFEFGAWHIIVTIIAMILMAVAKSKEDDMTDKIKELEKKVEELSEAK